MATTVPHIEKYNVFNQSPNDGHLIVSIIWAVGITLYLHHCISM